MVAQKDGGKVCFHFNRHKGYNSLFYEMLFRDIKVVGIKGLITINRETAVLNWKHGLQNFLEASDLFRSLMQGPVDPIRDEGEETVTRYFKQAPQLVLKSFKV